jgi:UDP-2,3-diacylglucosamine pyrophosphatase LpxH
LEDVFLTWVPALLKSKNSQELKVLLLGDIVDLIRTEQWLEINVDDRPWGRNGINDVNNALHYANRAQGGMLDTRSKTEQQCLKILGEIDHIEEKGEYKETILSRNREAFKIFRDDLPAMMEHAGIGFELIYLPGNHDRLCNLYPSVRDRIKEALGLSLSSKGENWWYPHEFEDEDYGVFARHGHEWDVWNYGHTNNYLQLKDFTRTGQLQVSIGDVIATEFAVKVPWIANRMKEDSAPGFTDDLVARLREVDNVRPAGNVIEWLLYHVQNEPDSETQRALEEAINRALDELFEISLVEEWTNHEMHKDERVRAIVGPLHFLLHNHRRTSLSSVENKLLSSLYQAYTTWVPRLADPQKDTLTEAALKEPVWENWGKIRYLLYGHTHNALIHPLRSSHGNDEIYINTGTWREMIIKTVASDKVLPQFVPLNQITYVIFYNAKEEGEPSFDMYTWTRASKAKSYG